MRALKLALAALLFAAPSVLGQVVQYAPKPCKMDGTDCAPERLLLGNGTAAAPSYSFAADPSTGFYSLGSGYSAYAASGTGYFRLGPDVFQLKSTSAFAWSSGAIAAASDLGLARAAAGWVKVTDGGVGYGNVLIGTGVKINGQLLTSGTMTPIVTGEARKVWNRYDWDNAMVVALGAVGAGDIVAATLPAKTVVSNMYVVITAPDTSANALTVACGRTSALYIDYIVASDAKAAAGTVYGNDLAERGTNLTGYDLPNFSGTTTLSCHFIKSITTLDTVTGSTGSVYIETSILP